MHMDTSNISLLVLDFDGVMTDNRVLVNQDGMESVWCNRSDGWGIARIKELGIEVIVISTETNPVVQARCQKLGVACVQGCNDKLEKLKNIAEQKKIQSKHIAYIGNDVNDLECLEWVGLPIGVADSHPAILSSVKYVTNKKGGKGAVREVCDLIIKEKGNCK